MACPEFEELIAEGCNGHAAHCEECRALLEAFTEVDSKLDAAFAGIPAPSGLRADVQLRIARDTQLRRPSLLPEVLDFIGWAAVLAMAAILFPRLLPLITSIFTQST